MLSSNINSIILQNTKNSGDYGERVEISDSYECFCEGFEDGDKEYIKSNGVVYERYTCYSVISPYGWKISNKTWEEVNV